MLLLLLLLIPTLTIGVSIHYLINYPYGFFEALTTTLKWIGIAFLVVMFIAICA